MRKILLGFMLCLIGSVCFGADDFYFHETRNSNCYEVAVSTASLANGTSCQFMINLSSNTLTKSLTGRFEIYISSMATISLYENPVYVSTGTALGVYNKNRTSSKTSQGGLVLSANPGSISSTGTTLLRLIIPSQSTNKPIHIDSRIFAVGRRYILDINNNAGAATPVTVKFEFYEN